MKSTIPLILCESSNIAGYGYDIASNTLAIRFKSGPGGTIYHYAGVSLTLYAEFCGSESKGKFFAQRIKSATGADGQYLYPATLMKPEQPDDDEGDEPMPAPPTPKDPPQQDGVKPIGDPQREAA
jgi:hypothetical protein